MRSRSTIARSIGLALALAFAFGSMPLIAQHGKNGYVQHNLVSDGAITADHTDPNLVNAWGVAFNPNGFVWVANNHTGTSTLYDGNGNPQSLVVNIPTPMADSGGSPTGIVYNASSGFVVTGAAAARDAALLSASADLNLQNGWSLAAGFEGQLADVSRSYAGKGTLRYTW